jgi:putative endonuclease
MYFTYRIFSLSRDKFYVGCTSGLEGRLRRHNTNHPGFPGTGNDWEMNWPESYRTKEEAIRREAN